MERENMSNEDYYIKQGHEILDKKYWEEWDEIVPIRCSDLYGGMELADCLKLIRAINRNVDYDTAKQIFDNQNHSGMSASLVRALVIHFCEKGKEYMDIIY